MNNEFNPIQTSPYGIGYKLKSRLWRGINGTIFRWLPFFMRKTRVAILRMFGAKVCWSCSISGKAQIIDPWNLKMGDFSSIDEDCCIRCRGKVEIGKKTIIGRGVDILSGSHDISSPNFELITAPIIIGDYCWIATKSIISKGVIIGEGAVIAAATNVVKNVEPWSVVGGNPARFIKKRVIVYD